MTDQTLPTSPRLRASLLSLLSLGLCLAVAPSCTSERAATDNVAVATDQTTAPASVDQVPQDRIRALKDTPFERAWDLDLHERIHTSWISPNVPDLVFFQTEESKAIYAVDTMSGATRWVTTPLPRTIMAAHPPYVARVVVNNDQGEHFNDDRLYVISDDILFCFDAIGGQLIWRYQLPFSPSTGPLALGNEGDLRVYIGDWAGHMRVSTVHPNRRFPYEAWQWNIQSSISASPIDKEDLVYVGDHNGKMHCFGLDREKKWTFAAGSSIAGSAVARDRSLFFGNGDNVFYVLNRLTGEKLGQVNLNGPVTRQPFLFRDETKRVYTWVSSANPRVAGVYAIRSVPDTIYFENDSADHPHRPLEVVRLAQDWHFPGVTRLVSSTPQHLYMTYPDSTLVMAIRRDNGSLDWAWDCAEERGGGKKASRVTLITEYQDPSDLNRSIYTCDDSGRVISYRFFGFVPRSDNTRVADKPQKEAMPKSRKAK
ncbi:MAG: PQQ-like beta-propeller repeat protein [Planctomycetes bacterium]|nr:PQQ-like beta-propeller repeat protein [Planctomycetota bacterium]